MLDHGGRLFRAARQYGIPLSDWIDLSTGINPNGWPVPPLPEGIWQRLPEEDDELVPAAREYYQNESLIAVAGSQVAIQTLPLLRPKSRVGVLHPAYAEHSSCWQRVGHSMIVINETEIDSRLDELDVLIIVNPNNPTGKLWSRHQLLGWHEKLSYKGGWLIVGKFFGLAGIRCGFVIAEKDLLNLLQEHLGPWAISHPSRYVATHALSDRPWQRAITESLKRQGQRLACLLTESGWPPTGGCAPALASM